MPHDKKDNNVDFNLNDLVQQLLQSLTTQQQGGGQLPPLQQQPQQQNGGGFLNTLQQVLSSPGLSRTIGTAASRLGGVRGPAVFNQAFTQQEQLGEQRKQREVRQKQIQQQLQSQQLGSILDIVGISQRQQQIGQAEERLQTDQVKLNRKTIEGIQDRIRERTLSPDDAQQLAILNGVDDPEVISNLRDFAERNLAEAVEVTLPSGQVIRTTPTRALQLRSSLEGLETADLQQQQARLGVAEKQRDRIRSRIKGSVLQSLRGNEAISFGDLVKFEEQEIFTEGDFLTSLQELQTILEDRELKTKLTRAQIENTTASSFLSKIRAAGEVQEQQRKETNPFIQVSQQDKNTLRDAATLLQTGVFPLRGFTQDRIKQLTGIGGGEQFTNFRRLFGESLLGRFLNLTPVTSDEEYFRSAVATIRNVLIRIRSGASVTANELQRAIEEFPQATDLSPEQFFKKLDLVELGLRKQIEITAKNNNVSMPQVFDFYGIVEPPRTRRTNERGEIIP